MSTWAAVLDDFERATAAQRAALLAGRPEDAPGFTGPADLGPLPTELQARASSLLCEAVALDAEVSAALSAVQRELAMLGRMRPAERTGASYIDSSL